MVSVGPAGFNAITGRNTLLLFKAPSDSKVATKVNTPTIDATFGNQLSIIAGLAAKFLDLKNHGDTTSSTSAAPPHVGDGVRSLNAGERATEKANFEAYFQAHDDDDRANFSQKVTDLLLQNDLYRNDPSFQAALKNGTLSIQSGDVIGLTDSSRTLTFNNDGYYAGVKTTGFETPKDIWAKIENVNGRYISKADGKNVAIGLMNQLSFYVTWPSE